MTRLPSIFLTGTRRLTLNFLVAPDLVSKVPRMTPLAKIAPFFSTKRFGLNDPVTLRPVDVSPTILLFILPSAVLATVVQSPGAAVAGAMPTVVRPTARATAAMNETLTVRMVLIMVFPPKNWSRECRTVFERMSAPRRRQRDQTPGGEASRRSADGNRT